MRLTPAHLTPSMGHNFLGSKEGIAIVKALKTNTTLTALEYDEMASCV